MATIWCNGEWQDSEQSSVSWSDRGLLHGLGLFETLLAVDGQAKHAPLHLARLERGMERLGWEWPDHDFESLMKECLERNPLQQGRVRIRLAITAGSGSLDDLEAGDDRLCWMTATSLGDYPKAVKVGMSPWRRNEYSPLAGLKCASYGENLMALDWAKNEGFEEVIFLNAAGHLCEAATANLFLVKDERLLTPSLQSGCLSGITRDLVIGFASEMRIDLAERELTLEDLKQADDCFLTSATRGVVPVESFKSIKYPSAALVQRLIRRWEGSLG